MYKIEIKIPKIPHGHGLSFKRGVADGLLNNRDHEATIHETNVASYLRGVDVGSKLMQEIAKLVNA
jgi:hypothetical protein